MFMIFKRKNSKEDLEKRIKKWLTHDEKIEVSVYEQLKARRSQFLVITNHRAILFESDLYGRLEDKSDKLWRQLLSAHLKQGVRFSSLDVFFFQHHDANYFHNPYQNQEPFDQHCWHLAGLNKEQAGKVYANLKSKECEWKEKRLEQYVELMKIPGRPGGMGGGMPPR
ncbi:MAG: PH domain-containing protein [Candidatus Electrothrix aestuarii]|uniref:PH domain-containing protein n=1 Tax=Candidatus Electrothrix aestuarii TaxID=3062594 RepID=A0AAU8LR31_9BACT|nr:PH domain-containing protein [Candidatus Electrothrix aestuarii]